MTRDIKLSTSSSSRTSRTGNNQGGSKQKIIKNGSISAHSNYGRIIDEEDERLGKKGGDSLAGGDGGRRRSPRRSIRSASSIYDESGEEDGTMNAISSPRAARYSARSARKNSVHQVPATCITSKENSENLFSEDRSIDAMAPKAACPSSKCRNIFFSTTSYSTLVTITIALLAWSMIQPTQAALSCTVSSIFLLNFVS